MLEEIDNFATGAVEFTLALFSLSVGITGGLSASSIRAQHNYVRATLKEECAEEAAFLLQDNPDKKCQALQQAFEGLCSHPAAATLKEIPRIYVVSENSSMLNYFKHKMVAAASTEDVIFLSDQVLERLTVPELKGIAAHELAHIVNGDLSVLGVSQMVSRTLNERTERRADKTAAALLDYEVEPLISGLEKIVNGKRESDAKNEFYEASMSTRILGFVRRTHPAMWARKHYLRKLASEHGVGQEQAL